MRYQILSAAMVALFATGATAWASPDAPRSSRTRKAPQAAVVAIMAGSGQALLWDGTRDEYVVVRRGDRFHEYRVTAIDDDQVVLSRRGSNQHFVLPRTSDTSDLPNKRGGARDAATRGAATRDPGAPAPRRDPGGDLLNPYPMPKTTSVSAANFGDMPVLDPYAPVNKVSARKLSSRPARKASRKSRARKRSGRSMSAPLDPYAAVPSTSAKGAASVPLDPYASASPRKRTSASAPLDPYASTASKAVPLDPYASAKPQRKPRNLTEKHRISRREFDAAVTDFHALSKEVQLAIVGEGVLIEGISRGSLFHRWGFRDKDVILAVDGKPIRGVDDAAAVYAHLVDAKRFKVKVKRGVDTVNFHYRFKK